MMHKTHKTKRMFSRGVCFRPMQDLPEENESDKNAPRWKLYGEMWVSGSSWKNSNATVPGVANRRTREQHESHEWELHVWGREVRNLAAILLDRHWYANLSDLVLFASQVVDSFGTI